MAYLWKMPTSKHLSSHTTKMASNASEPLCLVVSVEISPERVDAFLAVMKVDAEESRKEEGCLRFDVLRDESNSNKFIFYEVASVLSHIRQQRPVYNVKMCSKANHFMRFLEVRLWYITPPCCCVLWLHVRCIPTGVRVGRSLRIPQGPAALSSVGKFQSWRRRGIARRCQIQGHFLHFLGH